MAGGTGMCGRTVITNWPAQICALAAICLSSAAFGDDGYIAAQALLFTGRPDAPMRMPTAVTVTADGKVWVADGVNNRVLVFNTAAEVVREIREAGGLGFRQPVGVGADGKGGLWIADTGNQRLVCVANDGTFDRWIDVPRLNAAHESDI